MSPEEPGSIEIGIDAQDHRLVISPSGDIDLSSSPAFRQTLQANLAASDVPVVIDLAGVPYMDSSGVATLVEALQICRRCGREFSLARPSERVASIFQISKLDTVFTITADLDAPGA